MVALQVDLAGYRNIFKACELNTYSNNVTASFFNVFYNYTGTPCKVIVRRRKLIGLLKF